MEVGLGEEEKLPLPDSAGALAKASPKRHLGRSVRYWGRNNFPNHPFLRRGLLLSPGVV
jgi:hypothetical protein